MPIERPMVGAGLILYYRESPFWYRRAATDMHHVEAFERYSRFGIRRLNTDQPFPRRIATLDFELVIVHYTIIGGDFYHLTEDQLQWLKTSRGHKVLLSQDEDRYCGHRFWFCDEVGFDTVDTMLEPPEFEKVYGSHTQVPRIRNSLPGYVSEEIVADAERFARPDEERSIDVGYRGRPVPAIMGRGGQEKYEIGRRFLELAADSGLTLDIGLDESTYLFGDDWPRFLGRCRGVLGVESGASVFDLDDRVMDQYERLTEQGIEPTAENLDELPSYEDRVFYRTISPRHFEAAAMRTCQILFEGRYSGVMEPMVHYIPLRKDFSNLDEVLRLFRDPGVRRELTENAHRDLIASGRYSYERFVEDFDDYLVESGVPVHASGSDAAGVERAIERGRRRRWLRVQLRWIVRTGPVGHLLANLFRLTGYVRARVKRPETSTGPSGGT